MCPTAALATLCAAFFTRSSPIPPSYTVSALKFSVANTSIGKYVFLFLACIFAPLKLFVRPIAVPTCDATWSLAVDRMFSASKVTSKKCPCVSFANRSNSLIESNVLDPFATSSIRASIARFNHFTHRRVDDPVVVVVVVPTSSSSLEETSSDDTPNAARTHRAIGWSTTPGADNVSFGLTVSSIRSCHHFSFISAAFPSFSWTTSITVSQFSARRASGTARFDASTAHVHKYVS
mmetsp:Transcript_9966/g.28729  ORF Transcript_9966/g.28729 Transcript_9966/m.28729 type:complete len:235 (+) Transcript_9966:302-1006(+)